MVDSIALERLEKTSRLSAVLMGLGALVVMIALWFSYEQLREIQSEVNSLQVESARLQSQNSELSSDAQALRSEVRSLQSQASELRTQNSELVDDSEALRNHVKNLREALGASRYAIIAFHQGDYDTAIDFYDQALRADPDNAYLLNLKAYSHFKLEQFQEAIEIQIESTRVDPNYAWGFFDLARFHCAAGDMDAASEAMMTALEKSPGLENVMNDDGEFQRLCAPILR